MKLGRRFSRKWVMASVATAALVGLVVLPVPAALGLTSTLSTSKPASGDNPPEYKLGEKVVFTGKVGLAEGEAKTIQKVVLDIQGPQLLNIELPLAAGTFDLTSQLPKGANNQPLGSLTVDVELENVILGGVGYGYGYGGVGGGFIEYTLYYTHPVLKYPAPHPAAGPLNNPTFMWDVPQDNNAVATVNSLPTLEFTTDGALGGKSILGLAYDGGSNVIWVLLDDPSGNDKVAQVDTQGTPMGAAVDTGVNDAEDVAVLQGDVYIVRRGPANKDVVRVVNNGDQNDTPEDFPGPVGNQGPNGNLTARGLFFDQGNNPVILDFQPDGNQDTVIHKWNPGMSSFFDIFVDVSDLGGGFQAGTRSMWGSEVLVSNGPKILQVDWSMEHPASEVVYMLVDSEGAPLAGSIKGMAATSGNPIYVGIDNKVYSFEMSGSTGGFDGPTDIALTSDKVFVSMDHSYSDQVIILNHQGAQVDQFFTGYTGVNSLTVAEVNGEDYLFFVDNDTNQLLRLNLDGSAPGSPMQHYLQLPEYVQEIGDLAVVHVSDQIGDQMLLASRYSNDFYLVNHTSNVMSVTDQKFAGDGNFGDQFFPPNGLDGIATPPTFGDSGLWGGMWNQFFKFGNPSGAQNAYQLMGGQMAGPVSDIRGLARVSADDPDLWLVTPGFPYAKVYRAALPGAPAPETTTAGTYSAYLKVTHSSSTTTTSAVASYKLVKVDPLVVTVTSPADNTAVGTTPQTVTGTVNDPTVTQVTVGGSVEANAILFGNPARSAASALTDQADRDQYTKNGLWRFDNNLNFNGQPVTQYVAQYGKKDGGSANYHTTDQFGNPQPNAGELTTSEFLVGAGGTTTLSFTTKLNVPEYFLNFDLNRAHVQWVSGSTVTTVGQLTTTPPMMKKQGPFGGPAWCEPIHNAVAGTVYKLDQDCFPFMPNLPNHNLVFVPPMDLDGNFNTLDMVSVALDLSEFAGQTGAVRFHFESVEPPQPWPAGWLVDDVKVVGPKLVGATVNVTPDPSDPGQGLWSAEVKLSPGSNEVTVTASRTAYAATQDTDTVHIILDVVAPLISLDAVTSPTNLTVLNLTGDFTEEFPDTLTVKVNGTVGYTNGSLTGSTSAVDFSAPLLLSAGANTIVAEISDTAGNIASATTNVLVDQTNPSITGRSTIYPVGDISARAGDLVVFQVKAADDAGGAGVDNVKYVPASGTATPLTKIADVPVPVRDMLSMASDTTHVFFYTVPSDAQPGTRTLNLTVTDKANNTANASVSAVIVPALEGFNRFLMPGVNYVGTPLQCTGNTVANNGLCSDSGDLSFDIAALLEQPVSNAQSGFSQLKDVVDTVFTYDGGLNANAFRAYTTGASADTLTKIDVQRGYFIVTKSEAFKESASGDPNLPNNPTPIKMTFKGAVLKAGVLPPTYSVVPGWNLVSLHSEKGSNVNHFLGGIGGDNGFGGAQGWASLFTFENRIKLTAPATAGGAPGMDIKLGNFSGRFPGAAVDPGDSFWLFKLGDQNGILVPVLE